MMKTLRLVAAFLTMAVVGQAWSSDISEDKLKALEGESHQLYIAILADHKQVGITEATKREVGNYYRNRRYKRIEVCGFRQDFPCHYRLEQETSKVFKTYQQMLIRYKADKIDIRKVPPIDTVKVHINP